MSDDMGDNEARAMQMQSMKDAAMHLQAELVQKDEQLTAFKLKTKAYVESKNKQHAEALEAEQSKRAEAQTEIERLRNAVEGMVPAALSVTPANGLMQGGGCQKGTLQEHLVMAAGIQGEEAAGLVEALREQLSQALAVRGDKDAAIAQVKLESKNYILKAKAAADKANNDGAEREQQLHAQLMSSQDKSHELNMLVQALREQLMNLSTAAPTMAGAGAATQNEEAAELVAALREQLAQALGACDEKESAIAKVKEDSKKYILKAKAAAQHSKDDAEERIILLQTQLTAVSLPPVAAAGEGGGEKEKKEKKVDEGGGEEVELLKAEVAKLSKSGEEKAAALESVRDKSKEILRKLKTQGDADKV